MAEHHHTCLPNHCENNSIPQPSLLTSRHSYTHPHHQPLPHNTFTMFSNPTHQELTTHMHHADPSMHDNKTRRMQRAYLANAGPSDITTTRPVTGVLESTSPRGAEIILYNPKTGANAAALTLTFTGFLDTFDPSLRQYIKISHALKSKMSNNTKRPCLPSSP